MLCSYSDKQVTYRNSYIVIRILKDKLKLG